MAEPSIFEHCIAAPPDAILGISAAFQADDNVNKVDLGIGAYRTEEGLPYLFKAVQLAERAIVNDGKHDKEYLPIDGVYSLKQLTQHLLFGECKSYLEGRICSVQSISGAGALRLAAEFIAHSLNTSKVAYISSPTWSPHKSIFEFSRIKTEYYPYWNEVTKSIDIEKMLAFLRLAKRNSILVLHTCAHNPTGMDPTHEQWQSILKVVQVRQLIPILDTAYHGFASGDLESDAYPIRLFEKAGIEMFIAQSFAKNFGLYGERIGMLHIVCKTSNYAEILLSQLNVQVRNLYSNPPKHGAIIVNSILSSPSLTKIWKAELKQIADRLSNFRVRLYQGLVKKGTPGNWDHIKKQSGMFSFTGLSPDQCDRMRYHWHIYMLRNGRINLAGLNGRNLEYVLNAIDDCVRMSPSSNSKM